MRRKKKTIECIEYLSVSAPLDKVDRLEAVSYTHLTLPTICSV